MKKHRQSEKLFVELFLKYESKYLSKAEIARTRREGLKNIIDGEFWWKIFKEYTKKVPLR